MLQRRLKLGYARASRLIDEMEKKGIVGPFEGSKPRQILITKQEWDQRDAGAV
jgi:S-DNA-T family DNA segregation ATPase FtsK/SpoIIIE